MLAVCATLALRNDLQLFEVCVRKPTVSNRMKLTSNNNADDIV
jgi:hypothetical protein